jgi:hypothetical protein
MGRVSRVARAKGRKRTPQVEKTAVEKWVGRAERRMRRIIC